jgi:hypothetical protein
MKAFVEFKDGTRLLAIVLTHPEADDCEQALPTSFSLMRWNGYDGGIPVYLQV